MKLFQPVPFLDHEFISTVEQLSSIASLRYQSYLEAGHIEANESNLFIDEYDFLPSTTNIGIWWNNELVAAMRLHVLSKDYAASATYSAFEDMLKPNLDKGDVIVDFARFVVSPNLGKQRLSVMAHTLYVSRNFAVSTGANTAVAAVSDAHVPFYRRVASFEKQAEPRPYGGLNAELALISVLIDEEKHGGSV